MIDDIKQDTQERMGKALEALSHNFNKIRTGRAHPSCLLYTSPSPRDPKTSRMPSSA